MLSHKEKSSRMKTSIPDQFMESELTKILYNIRGDSGMASAFLDRILHHCTIINITGELYKPKDMRKNSLSTMRNE